MSPEQHASLEGIDLERGQKRLAEMGIAKPNTVTELLHAHGNVGTSAVSGIAVPNATPAQYPTLGQIQTMAEAINKPPRKPRADKGIPREPKPKPAQETPAKGTMTYEQSKKLRSLFDELQSARIQYDVAHANLQSAGQLVDAISEELDKFITSITAD
jgi:hypothetical protein